MHRELLKREIFNKIEAIEDKFQKMFHDIFPDIEKEIWDAIDNNKPLVPLLYK